MATTFYTDTLFAKEYSSLGHKCAQVYTNAHCDFVVVIPLPTSQSGDLTDSLYQFVEAVRVPDVLVTNVAPSLIGVGTSFVKACRQLHIMRRVCLPHDHCANCAEVTIRELKKLWKKRMIHRNVPKCIKSFGLVFSGELLTRMVWRYDFRLGYQVVLGETPDISKWIEFGFYDYVWFLHIPTNDMLDDTAQIGRWSGAAHNISSHLCYYVLSITGHVLARATVRGVTQVKLQDANVQAKIAEFDHTIASSLVVHMVNDLADLPPLPYLEPDEPGGTYDSISERDELSDEVFDRYLGAELQLDRGGEVLSGTVKHRKRDMDGTLIGTSNGNPMLDTREYLVELSDGSEEK